MAQRSVSEILDRLPGMRGGRGVRLLADGPTNVTWLVEADGQRHVLRLDKAEAHALGLDRANERAVCDAVAAAGLTPAYTHCDVAGGVWLRPYVAGRCLDRDALHDPAVLTRLARLLQRLHRLPPLGRRFDPAAAARRYADQLGATAAGRAADSLADRVGGIHAAAGQGRDPAALCHNDLVAENILETADRGLLLIDWEYAAVGDPFFDLAVVVRHHGLPDALAEQFLAAYLDGAVDDRARERLALQCDLYAGLLELWQLRIGPAGSRAAGDPSTSALKSARRTTDTDPDD